MSRLIYGLYDLKNNEICIGLFTAKELINQFNLTIQSFYCQVSRKQLLKNRYEVAKFKKEDLDGEDEKVNMKIKKISIDEADQIIDNRKELVNIGKFYFKNELGGYTGIDNEDCEAWTEDFKTLRECKDWLQGNY